MTMYAWIENDIIRDICEGNPSECYHPDVAQFYSVEVPDDASRGDGWVDGALVKAPVVEVPAPVPTPPIVSVTTFKMLFTSAERIAISSARASNPVIEDFYSILDDVRTVEVNLSLQSVQDMLGYLVAESLLTEERKAAILTGVLV